MAKANPDRALCGANRKQGRGPCREPAGWGTKHPGEGRCKLHGGKSPRGEESPNFVHGLACRHPFVSEAERADFEDFKARFLEKAPTDEELLLGFRAARYFANLKLRSRNAANEALSAMRTLARVRRDQQAVMTGELVRVTLDGADLERVISACTEVLVRYVSPDRLDESLRAFQELAGGAGGESGGG